MSNLPPLPAAYQVASDFDWAMHPGGSTILAGAEKVMNITPEHMRASYDTYMKHGNSSSATIFSVMDRLREKDMDACAPGGQVKEFVVGCAFGPGIAVEMCMFRRNLRARRSTGLQTPPETESEASRSDAGDDINAPSEEEHDVSKEPSLPNSDQRATPAELATAEVEDAKFVAESLETLDLD
jgi:type III polyketide synthase